MTTSSYAQNLGQMKEIYALHACGHKLPLADTPCAGANIFLSRLLFILFSLFQNKFHYNCIFIRARSS